MTDALRLALAALACYRLSQLFAIDDGPLDMFFQLRLWVGSCDYGEDGRPRSQLGRLLACPYCLGIWAALLCAVLVLWRHIVGDMFLLVLGLAGAQAWLQGARQAG